MIASSYTSSGGGGSSSSDSGGSSSRSTTTLTPSYATDLSECSSFFLNLQYTTRSHQANSQRTKKLVASETGALHHLSPCGNEYPCMTRRVSTTPGPRMRNARSSRRHRIIVVIHTSSTKVHDCNHTHIYSCLAKPWLTGNSARCQ